MTSSRGGFTIIELLVAMMILSVGLLALLGTSALNTRTIMRERNIDYAAIYAQRRLELLRISACRSHADGSEMLMRGSDSLAVNSWIFTTTYVQVPRPTNILDGYQIAMKSRYFKAPTGPASVTRRQDIYEAAVSCAQ